MEGEVVLSISAPHSPGDRLKKRAKIRQNY